MDSQNREHAIVIGGGVAGLCAARAVSPHFKRVTLIERDVLPEGVEHRAGVPQSHHVHALLLRGLSELERMFPGLEAELIAAGAKRVDLGHDVAHCTQYGWAPRVRLDVVTLNVSRLLLESVLRGRVLRDVANLELVQHTRVTGFTTVGEGKRLRVTGVTTCGDEARTLPADLVIDASGRASKSLDWLEAAGISRPEEEVVDAFAGYASRFYELAPNPARWWRGMVIDPHAPHLGRWALLLPVEGNRCVVTLVGLNRDYPPAVEKDFQAFLSSTLTRELADELARAKPISAIHTHRSLTNRARHLERWKHDVGGLVLLGDSAIAFNPTHGQGMTMAAIAARALGELAAADHDDPYAFTRRFHKAQWKQLKSAWMMATGMDLDWPATVGKRPWGYRFRVAMSVSILRAAHEDPVVKRKIGRIFQLVATPSSLLTPGFIGRVLFAELRRRMGRSRPLAAQLTPAVTPPVPQPLPPRSTGSDAASLHLEPQRSPRALAPCE